MEQNQEDTHEPLKAQPVNQFDTGDNTVEIESPPPQDKNDILYIVLIAIGIGFALPFHRFAFDLLTFDEFICWFLLSIKLSKCFHFQLFHDVVQLAATF